MVQAKGGGWGCGGGGGLWLSDVVRANDIGGIIHDVTFGNVQHAAETFQQNTVTFIF